jgi:hypothetical protein
MDELLGEDLLESEIEIDKFYGKRAQGVMKRDIVDRL